MKIVTLRYLAIEVYTCVNDTNPEYLNDLFDKKKCPYLLRDNSIVERTKVITTKYGLKSFRDYGAHIWNILPKCCKADMPLDEFKLLIKSWNGPNCTCSVCALFI